MGSFRALVELVTIQNNEFSDRGLYAQTAKVGSPAGFASDVTLRTNTLKIFLWNLNLRVHDYMVFEFRRPDPEQPLSWNLYYINDEIL
jgi:hypothetical protein